ncbi:hypothetical protein [Flavobacterium adhaerens]|uniref:hypothetical protein n=1 Tax=Flavobacterium adhaerens TaxID=3149043 RepID=UPI0032B5F5FC
MKSKLLVVIIILLSISPLNAQQTKGITADTNWFANWTNFSPSTTVYKPTSQTLVGIIDKDLKLTKNNTYKLVGTVYITNKAVLSIEPGTVIRGEKESCGTLVITKGCKIIAEGTATEPIVFTSNSNPTYRRPGDWGGIIILGEAPINKVGGVNNLDFNLESDISFYGGNDVNSNSGILKYVRIEYSGHKINALKELNGLSLAGVGNGTKFDFIQISFSNDDSFEAYGGEVNFNHLISFRATDDDFDFTQGVQCTISNSVAIRNPFSSDRSGSRCFEIDSYDVITNADMSKKLTKITASNITLTNTEDNNQGLVREAVYIRDNSYLNINNSLVDGFSCCVLLENKIITLPTNLEKINIQGMQVNRCNGVVLSENTIFNRELANWYNSDTFAIDVTKLTKTELFINSDMKEYPDLRTRNTNPIVSK